MDDSIFNQPACEIRAELGEPIVFRTASEEVCRNTLETGSIWLRSATYYRELEDAARVDSLEGVNAAKGSIPLRFDPDDAPSITLSGPGYVGQEIVPHYLACFHGASIASSQWHEFGGATFGVKSLSKLAAEIYFRSSRKMQCSGYRYGPVSYRNSGLSFSARTVGSAAMRISEHPPRYLNPLSTDVLRKRPVSPFIYQDEYRIAVFVEEYLDNDPTKPLMINVEPSNFYPYPLSSYEIDRSNME